MRQWPCLSSPSSPAKQAGESNRGRQSQSTEPSRPTTPNALRFQVRAAWSHIPRAVAEPLPTDGKLSDELYNVRYRVGSASTGDLARLQQCLSRFRSVAGLETNTPGGD